MHYQLPGMKMELDGVERFLKEMGVTEPKEEASLKITSSNFSEETEIILLTPKQ
jgi:hypothetical protein